MDSKQLVAEAHDLECLDEAVDDAEGAERWYAKRSPTAAARFSAELEKAEAAILDRPEAWPTVGDSNRHYLLLRFPFSVVYRVEQSRVFIVAVWRLRIRCVGPAIGRSENTGPPDKPLWRRAVGLRG